MQTLTIANQKGGVGKSTLAVHLAWLAVEQGRPVLLVDLDGQANSSRTFAEASHRPARLEAVRRRAGHPHRGPPAGY